MRRCVALFALFLVLSMRAHAQTQAWVARYDGPAHGDDQLRQIATEPSGNVFSVGSSVGASFTEGLAVKYDTNGAQLWTTRYDGPDGKGAVFSSAAVDATGNLYASGRSIATSPAGQIRPTTVKLDPNGNVVWEKAYNPATSSFGEILALAVDSSANVYVTGYEYYSATAYDILTIKYDSDGNQQWSVHYPSSGWDSGVMLGVDSQGNVLVAGYVDDGATGVDYLLVKYNSNGNQLWAKKYVGSGNNFDSPNTLAIDASDNVVVAGNFYTSSSNSVMLTLKYDSSGSLAWARTFGNAADGYGAVSRVAMDGGGNTIVAGQSADAAGGIATTVKYDTNGNQSWAAFYEGSPDSGAAGLKLDSAGNIYVSAESDGAGTGMDIVTIKYGPNGNQLWVARYDGPDHLDDGSIAGPKLALDNAGNVFVAGNSQGSATALDVVTIKYAQSGATGLSLGDSSGAVGQTVNLTAALTSGGRPLSGKMVAFQVDGVAAGSSVTDSNGTAVVPYTLAEGTVGTHTITASFAGDGSYGASTGSATLTVTKAGTTITTSNVSGTTGQLVSLSATLTRTADGHPLSGKSVTVKIDGTEVAGSPATTGADGTAAVSYAIPEGMVGGHTVTFAFGGDADYLTVTGTASLTVAKGDTTLTVADIPGGYPGATVTLTAKLIKNMPGSWEASGRSISFQVGGVAAGSATTDSAGTAVLHYTIPTGTTTPTTQTITAAYAGDANYNGSTGAGTLTVRAKTTLTVTNASGTIGTVVKLKAKLKAETAVVTGATVSFKVDGKDAGSAQTDSTGTAIVSATVPAPIGNHTITAEFAGDSQLAPTGGTGTLTVNPIKTALTVTGISAMPGQTVNLKAVLKAGTVLLSGQTVNFYIDGNSVGSVATDANGVALLPHTVTEDLGTHTITATYDGDGVKYGPSSGSAALKVLAATKIVADVIKAAAGSTVTYGAKLKRSDDQTPLEGKTLSFYAGTTFLGSRTTDANGRATISTTAPGVGVKEAITVKFAGDTQYKASAGSGSITGT